MHPLDLVILLLLCVYRHSIAVDGIFGINEDAIKNTFRNISQLSWDDNLLEGDIDLNGLPIESIVDRIDSEPVNLNDLRSLDNTDSAKPSLWPSAIVPYEISSEIPVKLTFLIAAAIDDIQQLTCIRWLPRRPIEKNYVSIVLGSDQQITCRSPIGRQTGVQEMVLSPDCTTKGVVIHGMMHVLGFLHEQSRSDRDDYVTIIWENLPGGKDNRNLHIFGVDKIDNLDTNYDYSSILHIPSFIDGVEIIRPLINAPIGQREQLSEADVYKLKKLYQCVADKDLAPVCDPKIDCVQRAQSGQCSTEPLIMLLECGKFCSLCSKNLQHDPTTVPTTETTTVTDLQHDSTTVPTTEIPTGTGCPESWIKTKHACYKEISPQSKNGKNEICKSIHSSAHLPVFRGHADFSDFIENVFPLLINASNRIFKIAGEESGNTNRWFLRYSGKAEKHNNAGCEINYLNWDRGEPNNHDGEEQCLAVLGKSKKYHDVPCNLLQERLICQISDFDICDCPDSWTKTKYSCYKYLGLKRGAAAAAACAYPSHLPVFVNSEELKDFKTKFMPMIRSKGIIQLAAEKKAYSNDWQVPDCQETYKIDGSCDVTFFNWDLQEPNNRLGNEDCLALLGEELKYHDIPCNLAEIHTVCQISNVKLFD